MIVYSYERPASIGLILTFFLSGFSKIFSESARNFDINRINRIPVLKNFSFFIVVFAGLIELASTSVIVHDLFFDEKSKGRLSKRSENSVVVLIVFTILASLLFYVYPKMKYRALMSNISIISGLLFVYQIILRNTIQNVQQSSRQVTNSVIQRVNETLEKNTSKTVIESEKNNILAKGKELPC